MWNLCLEHNIINKETATKKTTDSDIKAVTTRKEEKKEISSTKINS